MRKYPQSMELKTESMGLVRSHLRAVCNTQESGTTPALGFLERLS